MDYKKSRRGFVADAPPPPCENAVRKEAKREALGFSGNRIRKKNKKHVKRSARKICSSSGYKSDIPGKPADLLPMSVEQAQRSSVHCHRGFLSVRDAKELARKLSTMGLQPCTNNYEQDYDAEGEWVHVTHYLQEEGLFRDKFPELRRRIIALARKSNKENGWGLDLRGVSVRVAEFHIYRSGGALPDMDHYDKGSLVTVDIMLEPARRGGEFETVEPAAADEEDGGRRCRAVAADCTSAGSTANRHPFHAGDALAFVSHKFHRVTPVERGERKVLVVELWAGEERTCGHRCERPHGPCTFGNDSEGEEDGEVGGDKEEGKAP